MSPCPWRLTLWHHRRLVADWATICPHGGGPLIHPGTLELRDVHWRPSSLDEQKWDSSTIQGQGWRISDKSADLYEDMIDRIEDAAFFMNCRETEPLSTTIMFWIVHHCSQQLLTWLNTLPSAFWRPAAFLIRCWSETMPFSSSFGFNPVESWSLKLLWNSRILQEELTFAPLCSLHTCVIQTRGFHKFLDLFRVKRRMYKMQTLLLNF